jgi:hypothetical protein
VDACLTVSKGASSSRCWTYSDYREGRHWDHKSDFYVPMIIIFIPRHESQNFIKVAPL